MYGLKQAALLAYLNLKALLAPSGYHPVVGTIGLWTQNYFTVALPLRG